MPEEALFFGRSGLFGLALSAAYWLVSYEVAGTILLFGFGLATAAAFVVLASGARRAGRHDEAPESGGPFADEGGRVALRSAAPVWVGLGLGVMSLGLGFGLWFVLAGLVPLGLGAATWLAEVSEEAREEARRP